MILRTIKSTAFVAAMGCGLLFAALVQADPPTQAPATEAASAASHSSIGLVLAPPGGVKPKATPVMRHVRKKATLKGVGPGSAKGPESP